MKLPSAALMIMTIGSLVGANAALAQATSQGALGANQSSTGGTNQGATGGTKQAVAPSDTQKGPAGVSTSPMPNSGSPAPSSSGVSGAGD